MWAYLSMGKIISNTHDFALIFTVTLLLLLLPTNESSCISPTMKSLGQEALEHLEITANAALRPHTGSHSVECIGEPKEHDRLNCSIIHAFSSYLTEAVEIDGLEDDTKLHDNLNAIRQRLEDLKQKMCRDPPPDDCQTLFSDREMTSENLEKLRSVLALWVKWFSKPME